MNLLIIWFLAPAVVPTGTLVWATSGLATAVILAVLLSATLVAMFSQRERRAPLLHGSAKTRLPSHEDSRLPSAA